MFETKTGSASFSQEAECKGRRLETCQLHELEQFGRRVNKVGANFAVCDLQGSMLLFCGSGRLGKDPERLSRCCAQALEQEGAGQLDTPQPAVHQLAGLGRVLAVVLKADAEPLAVALIEFDQGFADDSEPVKRFCAEQNVDYRRLQELLAGSAQHAGHYCAEMLAMLAAQFDADSKARQQIEMVGAELAQTYEELVLLHKLSTNMKVTESDANYLQMACDSLTDIVSVGGIAVLLERMVDDERQFVVAAGSGLIDVDERMAVLLENRLADELDKGREALLDSEVDSPFKYDWPENVKSIIAVPLYGKERSGIHLSEKVHSQTSMIGLMVAVNRVDKPDFDSTDVKLFNSVANSCAVFVENGRLFRDLRELLIGSLKALTSSIDAKDQYTRGHSERVAFISRWIGERVAEAEGLTEEEIHRLYLAGLLHDIGKMGISEAVLQKKGRLTEQEIDHIRQHPSIGAGILGEIKQMREIVPGVLYHHERVDGRGYPSGLKGDQIPLVGKIVGLADGFDAMTSKRVYRDALTVEQALAEIEKGLGTQFDEKIGKLFLACDVYELWNAIQDGSEFIGSYGLSSFSEYGAVAVGTLVR